MQTVSMSKEVRRKRGVQARSGGAVLGMLSKLGLTLALLAVVFFIGRVGLADFLRLEATTYIDKLNEGRVRLSMERLEKARQRLLLARNIDTANPVVPEYLAQVSYIRASYSGSDKELQRGYLNEALKEYRVALELRPNSGYLWAGEMTVVHLLMSLDESGDTKNDVPRPDASDPRWQQMMMAMKHAIQLAPWERGVLRQVMVVGTKYYPALGAEERKLFDAAKGNAGALKMLVNVVD